MSRGLWEGVLAARDAGINCGDGLLSGLYLPGQISPDAGAVCHQKVMDHGNGTFRWSSSGDDLRGTSEF